MWKSAFLWVRIILMKTKKLFLIFFVSLLAMTALIVSSFFLLYERTTNKQLISYGEMSLHNSILYIDTITQSTKDLLDSISLDGDISKLLNYDKLLANDLLVGLRRLEKYKSSNYFIDSIYIYNRDNNTVYTSSDHMTEASYSLSDFPDFYASEVMLDYDGIENMEPIFRTYEALIPRVASIPYLSFIRYNALNKKNTSNVIMVNIRQDLFSGLVHTSSGSDGELLVIRFSDGSFRTIAGDEESLQSSFIQLVMDRISSGENEFVTKSDGKKYIICSSEFTNFDNSLVFISDENTLLDNTQTKYYGNSLILLGILMGISLLLLVILSRKIWVSIESEMKKISNEETAKLEMEKSFERSRNLSFLHSASASENLLPRGEDEAVCVALFVIDSYDRDIVMKYEKREERNLLKEKICDWIRLTYSPLLVTYEDDARCVLIVENSSVVGDIKEQTENRFGISITVFLQENTPANDVQETYVLLSNSIPYGTLIGRGRVITLQMIEEREMTVYSIPDSTARALTDDILKLNIPGALASVEIILREVAHSSYRSAQLAILNLSVLIDDAVSKIESNNGIESTSMPGSLFYKFQHLESLDEIYESIKSLLEQTENEIAQNRNTRQSEIVGSIIKIIQDNYLNRDFSIITVSESLGMSASYLGKVFKRATGESFSRYVLNERMKVACTKLAETDEPIDSIVYSVGFGDTPYFYKLFKQVNGCTPAKYREEHGIEK